MYEIYDLSKLGKSEKKWKISYLLKDGRYPTFAFGQGKYLLLRLGDGFEIVDLQKCPTKEMIRFP